MLAHVRYTIQGGDAKSQVRSKVDLYDSRGINCNTVALWHQLWWVQKPILNYIYRPNTTYSNVYGK